MRFFWLPACQIAFEILKDTFILVFILRYFDLFKEIFVKTDASDYISLGVLSQKDNQGVLYPVAFISKKYNPAEYNYKIYNKELLVIICCFKGWRSELQGSYYPIHMLTNYRNLEYFIITKQLIRRQIY
jgi:RNase H-like domain found in reverse transcriptase